MKIALMNALAGLLVRVGGARWVRAGLICAALFVDMSRPASRSH
jgi:hypothetical protein